MEQRGLLSTVHSTRRAPAVQVARYLHYEKQNKKLSAIGENKMDNTKYIALSRQMGLWKQMNIVSNNMANMNTAGYKQDDAVFSSYIVKTEGAKGFGQVPLYFTQDFGTFKDFQEGAFQETGNSLDVALQGDAFFAIETPHGEMYTKKGQFSLDANGMIVTKDGDALLSENNEPFFIAPGEKEIVISENGEVSTETGIIGRLKLVSFENEQKLLKVGGTKFANTEGNMMTVGGNNTRVLQGKVEESNVQPIVEMTKMINLQRSYEYVQQMIDEEHERLSNTISTYSELI